MFVKNQLVNEMNNIKIANNIKLNVVNSNKALFTKEHNYIGGFDINIKKNEEIISISKNMEKIEINENEIPNWVKEELSKNKMRKIFRRR
jgi:DNA polymerase III delta subunit